MKVQPPTIAHGAMYQDLTLLLLKYSSEVSALEMLAIASNMVGKITAMQDQRVVTPKQAMEIIAANIELGNAQVVDDLCKSEGSA
jgi:hypothetical protein